MGQVEDEDEGLHTMEGNPWYAEEVELGDALNELWSPIRSIEILGPEKLELELANWSLGDSNAEGSSGRFLEVFGLEELVREYVHESDRPHVATVDAVVRSDDAQRLAFIRDRLNYCLMGNDVWLDAAAALFEEPLAEAGDVIVSCFCPMDILGLLLAEANGMPWTPPFLLIVRPSPNGPLLLAGYLQRTDERSGSVSEIVDQYFEDESELMFSMGFGEMWEKEAELLGALGLGYAVRELELQGLELTELPDPAAAFGELRAGWPSLKDELKSAFSFVKW